MHVCLRERERWKERRRASSGEMGGGDLSQGPEAYPGSTVGSSLDIAL